MEMKLTKSARWCLIGVAFLIPVLFVGLRWETGLDVQVYFAHTLTNREALETVYYLALGNMPLLQHIHPTTVDLVIDKPLYATSRVRGRN
jgi:hypothetical protein